MLEVEPVQVVHLHSSVKVMVEKLISSHIQRAYINMSMSAYCSSRPISIMQHHSAPLAFTQYLQAIAAEYAGLCHVAQTHGPLAI